MLGDVRFAEALTDFALGRKGIGTGADDAKSQETQSNM